MNCGRCGDLARVHVLDGYSGGQALRRFLCFRCADAADPVEAAWDPPVPQRRMAPTALLIVAGAAMVLVGTFADVLHWHGSAGVGWFQRAGLAAGMLLIVTGALSRADVVALGGGLLFAICALADVFGTLGSPGIGWKQFVLILAGLLLTAVGVSRRGRRRALVLHPAPG